MLLAHLLFWGCGPGEGGPAPALAPRAPGDRSPLSASCDVLDSTSCFLPWPSSTFTEIDAGTVTGLRVSVDPAELDGDDPDFLNRADGFSRLSPIVAGFPTRIDDSFLDGVTLGRAPDSTALRVFEAQPDLPTWGTEVPLWFEVVQGGFETAPIDLLIGYPLALMRAEADHVVVVTDELLAADGTPLEQPQVVRIALGLDEAITPTEQELLAYHAPTRELLDQVGVDPERVLRVWDFTTRSQEDVSARLSSMLAIMRAEIDGVGVVFDSLSSSSHPEIAGIARGHLVGVPYFLTSDKTLVHDADGQPVAQGSADASFRVVLPAVGVDGTSSGAYRPVLYGHGTSGSVTDNEFDRDMAANGLAKINLEFRGWRGDDLVYTIQDFLQVLEGTERSTAQLLQSIVDGYGILLALEGVLGEALAAEELAGEPNPLVGRPPDVSIPLWMGGSLGGSMGAVAAAAYPEISHAVLNVPSGAWTQIFPHALFYTVALEPLLLSEYGDQATLRLRVAMSQGCWDDVDGAVWAEKALADGSIFLLQESMDDPISPNPGTDVLARSLQLKMVGPQLLSIDSLDEVSEVDGGSGMTQYRVPGTDPYDIHGFAARDTLAGAAALEQIFDFTISVWAGAPSISLPLGCSEVTPQGDCDFSEVMDSE